LRSADGAADGWSAAANSIRAVANKPDNSTARFISELLSILGRVRQLAARTNLTWI